MQTDKLTEAEAVHCAGQLVDAIDRIRAHHDWSAGDLLAVATVAFTEILASRIGKVPVIEFFRDHADELEQGIMTGKT